MRQLNLDLPIPQDRRPIPGYEDRYEIDTSGQVYALFPFKGLPPGRKIGSRADGLGYVKTCLSRNGQTKQVSVHRLLMLTFHPINNPDEMEVNHIDGNPGNNDLSNLEWLTHVDNMKHAHHVLKTWDHAQLRGEQVGGVKLTAEKVIEIRRLTANGVHRSVLAATYGVTTANITAIVIRKSWAHVE